MNRRTSKLLDHVVNALIQGGDKPTPPKGRPWQVYNHARNLKRKLKAEWNKKPRTIRHDQRIGIVRTLVAIHEGAPANAS